MESLDVILSRLSASFAMENYTSSVDSGNEPDEDIVEKNDHSVFVNFYQQLLDDLMCSHPVGQFQVTGAIKHIIYNYRSVRNGKTPEELDYVNMANCLGYLHRYAACHSAMVLDTMVDLMCTSSPIEITCALSKSRLNTLFLGGGPGNDVVGFLTALFGTKHERLFDLDVTVVDKMAGWSAVFEKTVEKLRNGECGKAGRIFEDVNINTSFEIADLSQSQVMNLEIENKLRDADIIFLVKFLSHVPDAEKFQTLSNVASLMKLGALMIYLDTPFPCSVFDSLYLQLKPIHRTGTKQFNFNIAKTRFGYENITRCKGDLRVFKKH